MCIRDSVTKIAETIDSIHKQFHLEVNWSRSKTEVTVHLIAPTAWETPCYCCRVCTSWMCYLSGWFVLKGDQ
eukprot:1721235-Amphidinium_carterae.1